MRIFFNLVNGLMSDLLADKLICDFIFQIGFVNSSTKELCYKISRDLIVNITTLHPYLISSILAEVKDNYETVKNIEQKIIIFYLMTH